MPHKLWHICSSVQLGHSGGQVVCRWLQAQEREALRVSEILRKTQEKDVKLMTLKEARDHDNACRNLEKKLDLDLKREKVNPSRVCWFSSCGSLPPSSWSNENCHSCGACAGAQPNQAGIASKWF